jgi:hypothetical protein
MKNKLDNSIATIENIGNMSTLGRSLDPISENRSN